MSEPFEKDAVQKAMDATEGTPAFYAVHELASYARLLEIRIDDLLAVCKAVQKAASESSSEERFGERVTALLESLNAAITKAQGGSP